MNGTVLNVSVVTGYIKQIFAAEDMLHDLSVCGEVSGYKVVNRVAYFTLRDAQSRIDCVMYSPDLSYSPKEGESVLVKARVDFYPKFGKISLYCSSVRPYGKALLALKLEQLRLQLQAEGLFDESRKKAIPRYCKRVCVITSRQGAVIHDIQTTVRKVNTYTDLIFYDVRVQGESCAEDNVRALQVCDTLGYDVLILARGGGSADDLMAYNDERLVRQIAKCNTPVISAIGHESDFTFCDMVADRRCATPTAAAALVGFDTAQVLQTVSDYSVRMQRACDRMMRQVRSDLKTQVQMMQQLFRTYPMRAQQRLDALQTRLTNGCEKVFDKQKQRLDALCVRMHARDPMAWIRRGYWQVARDGKVVTSAQTLQQGDTVTLIGNQGKATATVTEVIPDEI